MLKPLASMVKRCLSALFQFRSASTLLNTEMGFVIESETLAQLIDKRFIQSQYDAALAAPSGQVGTDQLG